MAARGAARDARAAIAEARSLPELGLRAVRAVRELVAPSAVNFFPLAASVPAKDAVLWHERFSPAAMLARTLESLPATARELGHPGALVGTNGAVDLNARLGAKLAKTETFNEFWRGCHIERQLLLVLGGPDAPLGFVCAARSSSERPFPAGATRALMSLRAPLEHSLRELLPPQGFRLPEVLAVLRLSTEGATAVFDHAGRLEWTDVGADRLLELRWDTCFGSPILVSASLALEEWRAFARACIASRAVEVREAGLTARCVGNGAAALCVVSSASTKDKRSLLLLARRRYCLTAREAEVLDLLVAGQTNKEIAAELGCSVKTVEVHVGQLLRRARVSSRSALAALFWNAPPTPSAADLNPGVARRK